MSLIRVGLVGIGAQTKENLLPSLLQIPDVQIVAGCDLDFERAQTLRSYVRDVQVFKDVATMLSCMGLDALVLACPPQAHRDISLMAIERGVHVFVEKPPCFTLGELKEMIDAATRKKVVTGVGLNFRFARPVQQLRKIAASEKFGQVAHVQINHYANKPRAPLWGHSSTLRSFLLAQTIHSIDLTTVFGKDSVTDVHSTVQQAADAMLARIDVTFSSGRTASILTGSMFPYFEFDMKVISEKSSMITLDNLWNMTLHESEIATRVVGGDKRWRNSWQPSPLDSGYARSGYNGELTGFFNAIRTGTSFEADFVSMIPTYQVIEQVCAGEVQVGDTGLPALRVIEEKKIRSTTNA
ncbi:Gfo/Idh/MocA family protein [Vitiosangium sp. GDMCC 1.1324]|uniref:Gfo/Idh/MocA family protein n=1 Tax=Vitiosangium sp. (strain GDMCC 1.1324) TaxID=2138576 RepID=UPI000D385162|nr:Gfo/Idh/MocA family oxidoreductase [Vitiosangium sp. GDMCC 1.1324]PTL84527.1 gfo/Idh/MocA family oxidoreductase [Vitiosangium sp. GDMCC 1.1324]